MRSRSGEERWAIGVREEAVSDEDEDDGVGGGCAWETSVGTYRTEEDHQTGEAHRSPWGDLQTVDQRVLDAEDRSQTHQEGDYRSRMQL